MTEEQTDLQEDNLEAGPVEDNPVAQPLAESDDPEPTDAEPTDDPEPAPEPEEDTSPADPILSAAAAQGFDVERYADGEAFLRSQRELRERLSQRDEYAKWAQDFLAVAQPRWGEIEKVLSAQEQAEPEPEPAFRVPYPDALKYRHLMAPDPETGELVPVGDVPSDAVPQVLANERYVRERQDEYLHNPDKYVEDLVLPRVQSVMDQRIQQLVQQQQQQEQQRQFIAKHGSKLVDASGQETPLAKQFQELLNSGVPPEQAIELAELREQKAQQERGGTTPPAPTATRPVARRTSAAAEKEPDYSHLPAREVMRLLAPSKGVPLPDTE